MTKKQKKNLDKGHNLKQSYPLSQAIELVKKLTYTKFDASLDLAIELNVDPKKAEQAIRGTASLPHGTGKKTNILVFCTSDQHQQAQEAGADHVGLEDYIKKIEKGWPTLNKITHIIATPKVMAKIGKLGRILGPRKLMPNPKTGTVTPNPVQAIQAIKAGRIQFKTTPQGTLHATIGKASFPTQKLEENTQELMATLHKLKPHTVKGTYLKQVTLSSTMSPGVTIDLNSLT